MNNNIIITKASGEAAIYSVEKLRRSLSRSGADEPVIDNIIREINSKLYNGISTKKIYREAFSLLKKQGGAVAGRYNLKRAIMDLGPSGFPFEKYAAALFEWQGYKVKTQQLLNGICVRHEIDVFAENDAVALIAECKYHKSQGIACDVKIPLYIHSRYHDVLNAWNRDSKKSLEGWVVTNTKFTTDAIKYGTCSGLKLLGWNYPSEKNLARLVDESGLYPVTCLATLTGKEKQKILESGTVLCSDIKKKKALLEPAAISTKRVPSVLAEITALCG